MNNDRVGTLSTCSKASRRARSRSSRRRTAGRPPARASAYAVSRVALLDGVPIVERLDRITPEFATEWWHWFIFAQPDTPERVINADPDSWYEGDPAIMGAENHAE